MHEYPAKNNIEPYQSPGVVSENRDGYPLASPEDFNHWNEGGAEALGPTEATRADASPVRDVIGVSAASAETIIDMASVDPEVSAQFRDGLQKLKSFAAAINMIPKKAALKHAFDDRVDSIDQGAFLALLSHERWATPWHDAVLLSTNNKRREAYERLFGHFEEVMQNMRVQHEDRVFTFDHVSEGMRQVMRTKGDHFNVVDAKRVRQLLRFYPDVMIGDLQQSGKEIWRRIKFKKEVAPALKDAHLKALERARGQVSYYSPNEVFDRDILDSKAWTSIVPDLNVPVRLVYDDLLIIGGNRVDRNNLKHYALVVCAEAQRMASEERFAPFPLRELAAAVAKRYFESNGKRPTNLELKLESLIEAHSRMSTLTVNDEVYVKLSSSHERQTAVLDVQDAEAATGETQVDSGLDALLEGQEPAFVSQARQIEFVVNRVAEQTVFDGYSSEAEERFLRKVTNQISIGPDFEAVLNACLAPYRQDESGFLKFRRPEGDQSAKGVPTTLSQLKTVNPFNRK